MKRRNALRALGLGAGIATSGLATAARPASTTARRLLRIAHLTDAHLRPEKNIPARFLRCAEEVVATDIDFILNGGDTVHAVDYADVTRPQVEAQWATWKTARAALSDYDIYSCLGNHDMWWAAPDETDPMYGKPFAVAQLEIPARYYAFNRSGWEFIVLDSNNDRAGSLDEEQFNWLKDHFDRLAPKSFVLIMSHYPILSPGAIMVGGNHTDSMRIAKLFHRHSDKRIHCISGHVHLQDHAVYDGVDYYCNGALSGYWWGEGDEHSAGKGYYYQTPPGYAIIDLYADGTLRNTYHAHDF